MGGESRPGDVAGRYSGGGPTPISDPFFLLSLPPLKTGGDDSQFADSELVQPTPPPSVLLLRLSSSVEANATKRSKPVLMWSCHFSLPKKS